MAASEAGSGGRHDSINTTLRFKVVATILTLSDYMKTSGDIAEKTVVEKRGTTKNGGIATIISE